MQKWHTTRVEGYKAKISFLNKSLIKIQKWERMEGYIRWIFSERFLSYHIIVSQVYGWLESHGLVATSYWMYCRECHSEVFPWHDYSEKGGDYCLLGNKRGFLVTWTIEELSNSLHGKIKIWQNWIFREIAFNDLIP